MKKSIGRTTLSYDDLSTLLVEIESVVNSRPLTYGRRVTNTLYDSHFEVISTNELLTRRARHRHILLTNSLANGGKPICWVSERDTQVTKNGKGADIASGDVVILKNDTSNRMFWKLAKVEELLPAKDGSIRAAIVKVLNADHNPCLLKRSAKHLFPLEVNINNDIDWTEESEAKPTSFPPVCDTPNPSANTRPPHNAAMMGELMQRFCT